MLFFSDNFWFSAISSINRHVVVVERERALIMVSVGVSGGDSIYNHPLHTRSAQLMQLRHFLRADVDNIVPLTFPQLSS